MIQPVSWERVDPISVNNSDVQWVVQVYCGECQSFFQGVFNERSIDAFDEWLDNTAGMMQRELRSLEHENMEELVDNFGGALQAGHILPEDF